MKIYGTVNDYLEALSSDPGLAVVSVMMAAKSRGVTRAAIERMLQANKLTSVKIEDTQCILAKDLIDLQNHNKAQITAVRRILEDNARRGVRAIFYKEVMEPIGLSTNVPAHRTIIGGILGEISTRSDTENDVLLSVLVHKKTLGITRPSPAFFELAKSLNYKVKDPEKFIQSATDEVLKIYAK